MGSPKVESALAFLLPINRRQARNINTVLIFTIVLLLQNMINTSILVLILGLPYHDVDLVSGAQTVRPGWAGPVSYLFSGVMLTGCFFLFHLMSSDLPHLSSVSGITPFPSSLFFVPLAASAAPFFSNDSDIVEIDTLYTSKVP